MPRNKNMKQVTAKDSAVTRRSTPKTQGTRAGLLLDWREGSAKSGKPSVGAGKALRDGR
jgi:hypothetical protein